MAYRVYFNPDDLSSAIKTVLAADVILQGGTYLNTLTNPIWINRIPRDAFTTALLVEALTLNVTPSQSYSFLVRVHCYTELLNNGQMDARTNKILERCEHLLNGNMVTITNAKCQPLYSNGIQSAFFDPQDSMNKAHGVLSLMATINPN